MIKFLKSPTGLYPLAYNAGDIASLAAIDPNLEAELIEKGFATNYEVKEEPKDEVKEAPKKKK